MNIYIRKKKTYSTNISKAEIRFRLKALISKEPDNNIINILSIVYYGIDFLPKFSGYIGENTFSIAPEFRSFSLLGYDSSSVFYSIKGEIEEIKNGTKIKILIKVTDTLQLITKLSFVFSFIIITIIYLTNQPMVIIAYFSLVPIVIYLILTLRLIIGILFSIKIFNRLFSTNIES